jgi:uncharacterized protein (TIGR02996 family)
MSSGVTGGSRGWRTLPFYQRTGVGSGMNTERAFERAILDAPEDDAPRLVYADWLEERGDPRGEYLRVETALAKTPPGYPGYRPLRERVTQLRHGVDRAWGTTFGLRKITAVEDLVYYLREFHKSWSDSPGLDPGSLPADLPHGLALLYRELGGLIRGSNNPFSAQDSLARPDRIRRDGSLLEFVWENQGVWTCWCPAGAEAGDPPVYSNAPDLWAGPHHTLQQVCDSLSHVLATFCLQEAVHSAPCLVAFEGASRPREVLDAVPRLLWLNGQYVFEEPSHNFFDVPGHDVLFMDYAGLWLGSHSDLVLRSIRNGVRYRRLR